MNLLNLFRKERPNEFPGQEIKSASIPVNCSGIGSISVPLPPEKPFIEGSCPECGIVEGHWHDCSELWGK
jgi:hypothetical protein